MWKDKFEVSSEPDKLKFEFTLVIEQVTFVILEISFILIPSS